MLAGVEQLRPTFEAACDFGLEPEEVWEAAKAVASRYPPGTPVHKCREELIEALAQLIEAQTKCEPSRRESRNLERSPTGRRLGDSRRVPTPSEHLARAHRGKGS
jgi:hypothetical protein